jgi:phytoene dehydrogenase-like protein
MIYDGVEVNLMVLVFPMACFDLKSAGYPIGGSYGLAKKLEERYLALGGKVHYHTPVHKIIVEDNTAKGLLVRHEVAHYSDITLSAADWYFTVFEALEGKYATRAMIDAKDGRSLELFWSVVQCSFGINKDLSHLPQLTRFPLEEELVSPDGTVYLRLEVHIYHYDPTMAPPGKSTVVVSFYTKERNFWLDLRKTNRATYRAVKNGFLEKVLERLDQRLGGIRQLVEMTDIATPATFYRYTHNWQGSVQGFLPGRHLLARIPVKATLPGLKNFYYSSHWSVPVGGLPQAIRGARDVVRRICHQSGKRMLTGKDQV